MKLYVLEQMKKDKLYDYFKQNSNYIKDLNRDPNFYKDFKKTIQEKYKLRLTDKLSDVVNDIELISSIISTIN
jgi:hypothetical protein